MAEGPVGALVGLRVVDLSTYLPGPYASMLLADLGADVMHVEAPTGDPARTMPDRAGDDSALHWWVGRNKRSVALDLKDDGDRRRLLAAIADADVVIEGFRPGVARRLGVDYEACRAVRSDIVYCSVSSYGQEGRNATVPAHDLNYAAKAGMLGLSLDPAGEPVLVGFPVTDVAGGLHAAVGILAAVLHRERTGEGQFIDVGILAASIGLVGMQLMKALAGGPPRQNQDMNLGGDPAYGLYRCRDGRTVSVACIESRFWERLCRVLGREELIERRFDDPASVRRGLEEVFATRDQQAWIDLLGADDQVCFGPVNAIEEVALDPDVVDSGILTEQADDTGRRLPQIGTSIRMTATPASLRTPAPALGSSAVTWLPRP